MKKNILIVEDHELTRFGLKTTFEDVDFIGTIYEASSAEEALEIFKNNEIDLFSWLCLVRCLRHRAIVA